MRKIVEICEYWSTPSIFAEIEGELPFKNIDIFYATINAIYKVHNKRFRVFNIKNNKFDIEFYSKKIRNNNGTSIFNIQYDKYCVIDNIFYQRTDQEYIVFLRKQKLKQLENICQKHSYTGKYLSF